MVLSVYGISKSESYLAKSTKSSRTEGCWEENIVKTAENLGLKGYIKRKSSIKEVKQLAKKGIPVIVNWFSYEEAGHYSVIVGFNKDKIIFADPHFGRIREEEIEWFEDRWFDFIGPPAKDNLVLREIIVIHK